MLTSHLVEKALLGWWTHIMAAIPLLCWAAWMARRLSLHLSWNQHFCSSTHWSCSVLQHVKTASSKEPSKGLACSGRSESSCKKDTLPWDEKQRQVRKERESECWLGTSHMLGFSGLLLIGRHGNLGLCPAAYGTSYIRIRRDGCAFGKKWLGLSRKRRTLIVRPNRISASPRGMRAWWAVSDTASKSTSSSN